MRYSDTANDNINDYWEVRVVGTEGYPKAEVIRDFKDTVCPFFESDTLFLECVLYCF